MEKNGILTAIKTESEKNIQILHHLAKKIWNTQNWTPKDVQNRCLDKWDSLAEDIDSKIEPLIPIAEDRPISNLIFGSGGFSTGQFQVEQYDEVKNYVKNPPVVLSGIVTNKSALHQCNGSKIAKEHNLPIIEIDFIDWYHEYIDKNEKNPIAATRYWFQQNEENQPPFTEIARRFKIRQEQFHKTLGEQIAKTIKLTTDVVSARGYNFQFCSNLFKHQSFKPQVNDTHPADLSYVDPKSKERLYPGWQSGAVQLMMNDQLKRFRGSLIEVEYMDSIKQISKLDEGALLALGPGVDASQTIGFTANEIQSAMKIMDDNMFCTLEPTGLILLWGITEKKLPVLYQTPTGEKIVLKQRLVVVGEQIHSGMNAWGANLQKDIKELEKFLFP